MYACIVAFNIMIVPYLNLKAPVPAGGAVQENVIEVLFIAFVWVIPDYRKKNINNTDNQN